MAFGKVCDHLVYFLRFGMFGPRKIWQPWRAHTKQTRGKIRNEMKWMDSSFLQVLAAISQS
jgi:deoxyribodipyrimidine photolyase